jgi:hypothetical protein
MESTAPKMSHEINENAYEKPYYLAGDIYPDLTTLVKTNCNPQKEKKIRGFNVQEACKKMWSGHLVCSQLGGLLSITQLEHCLFRPCMR